MNSRHKITMDEECTITQFDAVLMVCVALFFDGIQVGLNIIMLGLGFLVTWIISIWAWLIFYLWFKIKGVNFMRWSNMLKLHGGGFLEVIPIPLLGALPVWTASVVAIILTNAPWSQRVMKLAKKI